MRRGPVERGGEPGAAAELARVTAAGVPFAPGGYTGWHSHPGPVLITVTKGELTFYEYDDGECKKVALRAGQTYQPDYVDSGRGHFVRNESGQDAEDVSLTMAPTKQRPFRGELDPPAGCGS